MKDLLKVILVLLPFFGWAQNSVVTITPAMFNSYDDQFYVAASDGWLFKQGSDTAWAKKDIDITGWKKLKPTELSARYADKDGKAECWFRIKIRFDKAFGNKLFGVRSASWGASDLYVNGKHVASFGNTGANGKPFREYSPYGNSEVKLNLKAGTIYTIALHFIDHIAFNLPRRLQTEDLGFASLIRITGPKYTLVKIMQQNTIFYTVWVTICTILSLFFWLLYFQNPFEKNLKLIALDSTFLTLAMFCTGSNLSLIGTSYAASVFYGISANLFIGLVCVMTLIILVSVFKRKNSTRLKAFLYAFSIVWLVPIFLRNDIGNSIVGLLLLSIFSVCIYYIISSWKNLKGAQWAIVFGLLLSLGSGMLFFFYQLILGYVNLIVFYLSVTGYALFFPLSLLVYVAMRFKEIIMEVQQNALKVVQLSEEKEQEALNRRKLLEEEVARQTAEIRTALDNLKATQTQLIQSEKMASLGELTAGIAHEIQNPLNFVNNFSEVNTELIEEMQQGIENGDYEEVKALAGNIKENQQKINQHGKRADFIVKGMLQHSRTSTGERQETNINTLADEFLKLSYHGLRARDKSFNAEMETNFDENLPKVNVIQQDIGRVLLNLFNNAFYAVNQKMKTVEMHSSGADSDYKPTVTVSTFAPPSGGWGVSVKDNGVGMPEHVKEKIMQPFFTTKPTGEGTGLGLSLTYDMVVKGHGGSIQVNSVEGEGSEFIVMLPIN